MSKVWTTFVIGGEIPKTAVAELEALVRVLDMKVSPRSVGRDGTTLVAENECDNGNFEELEAFCQEHGLTYLKICGAPILQITRWDKTLSQPIRVHCDMIGKPVVTMDELAKHLEQGGSLEGLKATLRVFQADTVPALSIDMHGPSIVTNAQRAMWAKQALAAHEPNWGNHIPEQVHDLMGNLLHLLRREAGLSPDEIKKAIEDVHAMYLVEVEEDPEG